MAQLKHHSVLLPKPAIQSHHDGQLPNGGSMVFTCQSCVQRKVKCDKALPACSGCTKRSIECVYETPAPRRKRKRIESVQERMERYEQTLRDNNLLKRAETAVSLPTSSEANAAPSSIEPTQVDAGFGERSPRLLASDGKTTYIASFLWRDLGDDELLELSDSGDETHAEPAAIELDALSGALLGVSKDLSGYRPSDADALKMWHIYKQNVEPLCKVLHIPTVSRIFERRARQPEHISRARQCLCFAIYHFAVLSSTDELCQRELGHSQSYLRARYHFAIRLALVNASWLKTTDMEVLQAIVLFLIAIRGHADIPEYWIFTGVAVRIAQRMGLHRDGETLGLPPFETEMRRRLFWQLLPLDGYAGGASGTGISLSPSSWDTERPSNINDSDISPGMTEKVQSRTGATEMIFTLVKAELSNFYNRGAVKLRDDGAAVRLKDSADVERLINELEDTVEAKYLRYCDVLDPLHFMTSGMTRAAANSARVRVRISAVIDRTISDKDRREVCRLANLVLNADATSFMHEQLRGFRWKLESFACFESLLCLLHSMLKPGFFRPDEIDTLWSRLEQMYKHRPEITGTRLPLRAAISRLTLVAWDANPPSDVRKEPDFIAAIRRKSRRTKCMKAPDTAVSQPSSASNGAVEHAVDATPTTNGESPSGLPDINFDEVDWAFWEDLIQEYESAPSMNARTL